MSLPDAVVAADPAAIAQLGRAAGLAALHSRRYAQAARKFTDVTACGDHGESADELMTAADAATYGGLCALATFERDELRRRAVDAPAFRAALESAPEIRGIIDDFYGSRYASALDALRRARPRLELDPHLRDVADDLRRAIRERALAQYVSPYVTVDLAKMAVAFGGDGTTESVAALEKELAGLIVEEKIAARIDSREKTLWKKSSGRESDGVRESDGGGKRTSRGVSRGARARGAGGERSDRQGGTGRGERARMIPSRRGRGRVVEGGGQTSAEGGEDGGGRRGERRGGRGARERGGGRWEWKGWTRRTRWISWSRAGRGRRSEEKRRSVAIRRGGGVRRVSRRERQRDGRHTRSAASERNRRASGGSAKTEVGFQCASSVQISSFARRLPEMRPLKYRGVRAPRARTLPSLGTRLGRHVRAVDRASAPARPRVDG